MTRRWGMHTCMSYLMTSAPSTISPARKVFSRELGHGGCSEFRRELSTHLGSTAHRKRPQSSRELLRPCLHHTAKALHIAFEGRCSLFNEAGGKRGWRNFGISYPPVVRFFSLVRTKAEPLPGFT